MNIMNDTLNTDCYPPICSETSSDLLVIAQWVEYQIAPVFNFTKLSDSENTWTTMNH